MAGTSSSWRMKSVLAVRWWSAETIILMVSSLAGRAVSFDIEDNELLPLSLQLDKSEYNEGESIKLRVSVPYRIEGEELAVSLSIWVVTLTWSGSEVATL